MQRIKYTHSIDVYDTFAQGKNKHNIVRFTMYCCSEFMEISKAIHFWKAYNVRSPKNNVYTCAVPLDPRCHGNENLGISTQY